LQVSTPSLGCKPTPCNEFQQLQLKNVLNAINYTLVLSILNWQLQYDDNTTPYNHKIKFIYLFNWVKPLEKNSCNGKLMALLSNFAQWYLKSFIIAQKKHDSHNIIPRVRPSKITKQRLHRAINSCTIIFKSFIIWLF